MKRLTNYNHLFIICILLICNNSCAQPNKESKNTERIYFRSTFEEPIVVPLLLDDSITMQSLFDTGSLLAFCVDSTFSATHSIIAPETKPHRIVRSGSAWGSPSTRAYMYTPTPTVKIGKNNLVYNEMIIENQKIYFASSDANCIFNIPPSDTTHVWEFNFQHNYMEIHSGQDFIMPSDCHILPIIKDSDLQDFNLSGLFYIKLPIKIKCANGDTITIEHTFMIDTGMPWDIALQHKAKELNFFNKQKDAVWTGYISSYHRYYNVEATLFNNMKVDSLRIYTFDYPNQVRHDYLIGVNFLKRFNVFFDLKKQRIGLQPIKNFQRLTNPTAKRYHLSFDLTPQNTLVIRYIADYKENYFKNAGLQKGDEITAINGIPYKNITHKEEDEMYMRDSIVYSVNRKGKQLKITVHIDKKEVQGE